MAPLFNLVGPQNFKPSSTAGLNSHFVRSALRLGFRRLGWRKMATPVDEVVCSSLNPLHRTEVATFLKRYGKDDNLVSVGGGLGRGLSVVARFFDRMDYSRRAPSLGGSTVRRGSPLRPRGAGKRRFTRGIKRFRISV